MDRSAVDLLKDSLSRSAIPSRILLDRMRMIDEDSRRSSQYQDPNYLPFYYHLSKICKPKSIVNIGFDIGLPLCCFLQGCPGAETAVCLQRGSAEFYSPRLGLSNIKAVRGRSISVQLHIGRVDDRGFLDMIRSGFDLAIVTDKGSVDAVHEAIEVCWSNLNLNGIISVENVDSNRKLGDVFKSFCKSVSREGVVIPTRYGNGLVQK